MGDIYCLAHYCICHLDRARVVGGLPDVVAIQEGKVNTWDIHSVNTMCWAPLLHLPLSFSFLHSCEHLFAWTYDKIILESSFSWEASTLFYFPSSLQSLNLTGNVWGEPVPEVSWVKNDKELVSDDRYKLKFEHGKFASITIAAVTTADSGKYALLVKNKYGTEAGEFTVSVYNPDDEDKEEKKD